MQKPLLTLLATTGLLLAPVALPQTAWAQRVVDVSPGLDSQNVSPETSISGQFDSGTGPAVDPTSVRVLVNGRDVTNRSTVTRGFFTYRPDQPFPPGPVQVQVEYRNVNGEQRTASWAFNVQQPQAAIQVNSVTHNATSNALAPGATFFATVNGTPGAQASVLLIQNGRTVRELPTQEVSPGVYVATLTVQASDRIDEGIVIGRLQRQNQTTYGVAPQRVVFSATTGGTGTAPSTTPPTTTTPTTPTTPPSPTTPTTNELRPRFTSHQTGGQVQGRGFRLVGQTRPNANVRVTVTSRVSVLGVVNLGSETLVDRDVTANNDGRFEIEVPAPRIPVPGTRYTVRATARSGTETSPATEITLTQN